MATNLENKINRVATNVTDALNAIAAKGVDISGMDSDDLAALIAALVKLPTLTTPGVAEDIRTGKQLIDGSGNVVTGTMPEQAEQTITPGTSDQTIAAGRYLAGTQTIAGDSNLVAENIASGKTIFGVNGSYTGGGKMVNGSFTPSSYADVSHTIRHGLGAIPNFACIMVGDTTLVQAGEFVFHVFYKGINWLCKTSAKASSSRLYLGIAQNTTQITSAISSGLGSATTSKIVFRAAKLSESGATLYYWIGVI